MHKVLVSACLIGQKVRFDGNHKLQHHEVLAQWQAEGRLVAVCPEMLGGLGVPRPAAEMLNTQGRAVLQNEGKVFAKSGEDVTQQFLDGAKLALEKAYQVGVRLAIMKENSPSCGVRHVYDGSFSGVTLEGQGVTTALLSQAGITVFSELEIDLAQAWLTQFEAAQPTG